MFRPLANIIIAMIPLKLYPTTINLTFTQKRKNMKKRKRKRKRRKRNKRNMMPTQNVVLTEEEQDSCPQHWGNCSESVPWRALHGQIRTPQSRVYMYRTINLIDAKMKIKIPCIKCQKPMHAMDCKGITTIRSF
jgi:hypothetical protein